MTDLRYENLLLKQQVSILAQKIDPYYWEAVVRESGVEAAEMLDADLKDSRTTPSIHVSRMEVFWRLPGQVRVLEKRIR